MSHGDDCGNNGLSVAVTGEILDENAVDLDTSIEIGTLPFKITPSARRLGADLVAPRVFGTIDCCVCAGEEFVQSWHRPGRAGNAHADGYCHGRGTIPDADWLRLDLAAHALGGDQRL